jgi:ADP-ribose pyrophosphatase YjhB (NUDIX family)
MMICFDLGPDRFNFRAAAVIVDEGHILLCQSHAAPTFWFLPGGRVDLMEATPETVRREMREELGAEVEIERLQFVVENFFTLEEKRFHEIGFYYRCRLTDPAVLDKSRVWQGVVDGTYKLDIRWFRLDELDQVDVRPPFLADALQQMGDGVQHIVWGPIRA